MACCFFEKLIGVYNRSYNDLFYFYGLAVKTGSIALQKFFLRTGCEDREYSFAEVFFTDWL